MRRLVGLGVVGALTVPFASLLGGCAPTDVNCEDLATCPHSGVDADGGGPEGAPMDGAVAVTEDGAEVAPADTSPGEDVLRDGPAFDGNCASMLTPDESPCLNENLAFFVSRSKGDDQTATGEVGAPFRTIGAALGAAKMGRKRLYICDDGTGYGESLTIDAAADPSVDGIALYGGFDCNTWTYATTRRAKINAPPIAAIPSNGSPASSSALTVRGVVAGIKVADMELGVGNSIVPGGSSIGIIVDTSMNVVFERVRIVAGFGADGAAGLGGDKGADGAPPLQGQNGSAGVCPSVVPLQAGGSWLAASSCGSRGGSGGPANQGSVGYPGLAGSPGADNSGPSGGGDGKAGAPGTPGAPGAASAAVGSFSVAGYKPAPPGGDGSDGAAGQGGGGGGASNATGTCLGASGAAGGMGGCGGKKGLGGGSGGASMGMLSWSSSVTLDHCELVVGNGGGGGNGGKGGLGGAGQLGGVGGAAFFSDGGDGVQKGGDGGPGGKGGVGGSGAGGNGGPSYGIVYNGVSPSKVGTSPVHGNSGSVGAGGIQVGGATGADGLSAPSGDELQVN